MDQDFTVMVIAYFLEAPFKYNKVADDDTVQISEIIKSSFGYVESLSLYAPLNRKSSSLMFSTDADFFVFDKPIEGKKFNWNSRF